MSSPPASPPPNETLKPTSIIIPAVYSLPVFLIYLWCLCRRRPVNQNDGAGGTELPDLEAGLGMATAAALPSRTTTTTASRPAGSGTTTAPPSRTATPTAASMTTVAVVRGGATAGMSGDCPICLDEFEEGEARGVLSCNHSFHPMCIGRWLLEKHWNCPVCRKEVK